MRTAAFRGKHRGRHDYDQKGSIKKASPGKRSKRTDIGSDAVRGFGPHRSRVDFEEVAQMVGDFVHPVEKMEASSEDLVREMFRKLLFGFFRLSPVKRDVVCHRVTGMTWKQIGRKHRFSLQAAEKHYQNACSLMPELAGMLPKAPRKTVAKQ